MREFILIILSGLALAACSTTDASTTAGSQSQQTGTHIKGDVSTGANVTPYYDSHSFKGAVY